MLQIPWLPVNSDKHFHLLFSRVNDTSSKKLSPLLNVYIKHLVVTTVYSGIIAAKFNSCNITTASIDNQIMYPMVTSL